MNDVIVRSISLPSSVHGFVMEDPAGDYNIYLNENDPDEVQLRALDHELQHIVLGHLRDDLKSVSEKEQEVSYGYFERDEKRYCR